VSELNGSRNPYAVDMEDPAVVARLAVLAYLHDDDLALDVLTRRRPDLDLSTLRLMAEIAAATAIDVREPYAMNKILYVRKPR
jgi:hypothetical protein